MRLFGSKHKKGDKVDFKPTNQLFVDTATISVEEIHNAFDTEVDKLLKEANITLESKKYNLDELEKAEKLKSLGFSSSKVVKNTKELKSELNEAKHLADIIKYFSAKYPQNKFITHDSVIKLCKKYGLILGDVEDFIGDVPDNNIKDMENFKILPEDKAVRMKDRYDSREKYSSEILYYKEETYTSCYKIPGNFLKIAAPHKDFDIPRRKEIQGSEVINKKLDDPIVLQPVYIGRQREIGYLIVTAWGPEASDSLIVNENMN